MKSRIEHRAFRWAAWRYWGRRVACWIGGVSMGTLVFVVLWFILEQTQPGEPAEVRAETAMALAFVVGLVGSLSLARFVGREQTADPLMTCPLCQNHVGSYYVMIVLSSGNCPHCGGRIIEE